MAEENVPPANLHAEENSPQAIAQETPIKTPEVSPATQLTPQPAAASRGTKKSLIKKLLVIIVFILIAAGLIFVGTHYYKSWQLKKRDAQRKQDFKTIKAGMEKIRVKTTDQKYYPSTISEPALVKTGALDKIPQDPINKSPYVYTYRFDPPACTNRCTGFTLTACLENKNDQEGIDPIAPCTTKSYKVTGP